MNAPAKPIATLQARAALLGATLQLIEDDRGSPTFVLTRLHVTRQLRSIEQVDAWLDSFAGKVVSLDVRRPFTSSSNTRWCRAQ